MTRRSLLSSMLGLIAWPRFRRRRLWGQIMWYSPTEDYYGWVEVPMPPRPAKRLTGRARETHGRRAAKGTVVRLTERTPGQGDWTFTLGPLA